MSIISIAVLIIGFVNILIYLGGDFLVVEYIWKFRIGYVYRKFRNVFLKFI
ncbi:hypothetical protein BN165_1700004 [Clostridioides difficile E1]|nr:hypothetical protein BN163_1780004 [Clostridioides difficile T5]CCK91985.1 hypothetical protein BN164_1660004 [Clostridioides difficile T20]CCK95690.1 hypothetical protein BN165_1700004 [Clostridioides difficile E1]CCK99660.1 hypothetical protein BN166_2210004 [Clostridioides difficile E10]